MEPLDWQKMGFEDHSNDFRTAGALRVLREKRLKEQQAIRAGLANSRLPEYASDAPSGRDHSDVYGAGLRGAAQAAREATAETARGFIKEHEATHGVMGMDAGIPTDSQMELPLFSEEQAACAMANLLSAPERGVDMVTLPAHYARYVIEPIRFICENKLDFFQGNVVKYIVRHDAKNGIEDIDKVIRYAQMYKRFLMKDPDWWKAGKPEDLGNG